MRSRSRRLRPTLDPPIRRAVRGAPPPGRRAGWNWLGASALLFICSLGLVVRVSAMPAEARTQETWYAYSQELKYDFTARVRSGMIYPQELMRPDDLLQSRLPQDPPVLRRVLVGPLAESLRIALPYRFSADRPARMRATYAVEGEIRVPGLWRRPYPLAEAQTVSLEGAELRLDDLAVQVPIRAILDQVSQLHKDLLLPSDQVEVRIRPVIRVEVEGEREPVSAGMESEFAVIIRNGGMTVEVDEPRTLQDAEQFEFDERVPLAMTIGGLQVPVARVRLAAYAALGLFALALVTSMIARWSRRRPAAADELRRLGSGLVRVEELTLPEGVAVVVLPRLEQLIRLHLQTERPVLQAGTAYYLLDGTTCYRYQG